MPFRPDFQLLPIRGTEIFPDTIQAPPITRVFAKVDGFAGADEAAVDRARTTLKDNTDGLTNFVSASRQNAALSGLDQYGKRRQIGDDVAATYRNNQGTEIFNIYVTVKPESKKTRPTQIEQEILISEVLDVKVPFRYWPFPGSQSFGNPPEWWVRADYVAFYDPFYAHDSIENPLTAGDPDVNNLDLDDLRRNVFYAYFSWRGAENFTPQNIVGFDSQLLLDKENDQPVGKTGIYHELCRGKQYWECEIVALPTDVPDGYSYGEYGPRYNNYNDNPLQRSEDGKVDVRYPVQLNTFFNPVIGLAPKYFKDLSFEPTTRMSSSMLGLDPRLNKPRSIGAVRTSNMRGQVQISTWHAGGIYVDVSIAGWPEWPTVGRHYVCALNPEDDRVSGESLPADENWFHEKKTTRGGYVWQQVSLASGGPYPAHGPLDGTETIPTHSGGPPWLRDVYTGLHFTWNGRTMQSRGAIGGQAIQPQTFDTPDQSPSYMSGTTLVRVEHYNTIDNYDNVLYGDFCVYDEDIDDTRVMVPLDQEGEHCPVLKGRGDFLKYYRSQTIPDTEPSYIIDGAPGDLSSDWQADNGTGIDTGVNLPALAVGDRVMIATDTTSRKVWFGKNGVWYGVDGAALTPEAMKNGEGYTTLMDVEDGADGPEYYPAATVKYGFTHVRLHLGATCRYQPPSGHLLFAASRTLKLTADTGEVPD